MSLAMPSDLKAALTSTLPAPSVETDDCAAWFGPWWSVLTTASGSTVTALNQQPTDRGETEALGRALIAASQWRGEGA